MTGTVRGTWRAATDMWAITQAEQRAANVSDHLGEREGIASA